MYQKYTAQIIHPPPKSVVDRLVLELSHFILPAYESKLVEMPISNRKMRDLTHQDIARDDLGTEGPCCQLGGSLYGRLRSKSETSLSNNHMRMSLDVVAS